MGTIKCKRRGESNPVTGDEIETIKKMDAEGLTLQKIATKMQRSVYAIGKALGRYHYEKKKIIAQEGFFDLDEYFKTDWTLQ